MYEFNALLDCTGPGGEHLPFYQVHIVTDHLMTMDQVKQFAEDHARLMGLGNITVLTAN